MQIAYPLVLVSAGHPWGAKGYRLAIILRQMWRSGAGSGSIYGTGLGGNSTALGSKSCRNIFRRRRVLRCQALLLLLRILCSRRQQQCGQARAALDLRAMSIDSIS